MEDGTVSGIFGRYILSDLSTLSGYSDKVYDDLRVSCIISIGCQPDYIPPKVKHFSFLDIRDECDQYLVGFWIAMHSEIRSIYIEDKELAILVHCVYGQSRSAATVLALHLLFTQDSLQESFLILKAMKPDISINPSFLYQLQFLENLRLVSRSVQSLEEANLLSIHRSLIYQYTSASMQLDSAPSLVEGDYLQKVIACKACKGVLASDLDIVYDSLRGDGVITDLIDEYWSNWMKSNEWRSTKLEIAPKSGCLLIRPLHWVILQVIGAKRNHFTSEQLTCPHCLCIVGVWEPQSLNVLCSYLPIDSYALSHRSILIQRKRK